MTYLSGNLKKKKSYKKYFILIIIFLLVVSFWSIIRKKIYPVLEPVVFKYGLIKQNIDIIPDFFSVYFSSRKTLIDKQKKYEEQIEYLENSLADKDAFIRENILLSSTTENKLKRPVVMYPVMDDITKIYSTIILSKGFQDGISLDNDVYIKGNQIVCRIIEVHPSTSKCLLLSSSGVVTEGVTSSSSINLSLIGRGGHFMANVARDTPISVGEIVYLRSDQSMVIGKVSYISNNNQDTSWHIFIEGAYNPLTSSRFYAQQK